MLHTLDLSNFRTALLLVASCLACGGADRPTGTIFTAREIELFGNGADYVQSPEELGGQWKAQWEKDQSERVELADAVAIVNIISVSDDETAGEDPYIRLVLNVRSKMFGTVDEELSLRVRRTDPGFPSIHGKSRSLLAQPFILALRWQKLNEDSDEVVPRWYLTPATEPVVEFVQDRINVAHGGGGSGRRGGRTVVIHNND